MKKKTLLIAGLSLLAAGLSAAALTGCGYKFEKYSFNYGGESENDWRALEYPDTDIEMDGLVNAEEYGEKYLSFSDVNGVNMKVYAHLGEEGVFFGFVSNDRYVNYNTKHEVFNNTSVEIQVAPNGTETLNSNVVQLRLGANGTPDQWVGFPSSDGYSYSNKYIPSMGVVHINGELNKQADGYSVELYLPYTSIGLSEKPDSVVCAPSFNTKVDYSNENRSTWTMMLGCDLSQPATWYKADETGMTSHTAGFSKKGNTITQSKGYNEFYYFDTVPSESYYLKTELTVTPTTKPFLNGDNFPKFGLVNKSENTLQAFYIDAAGGKGTNFGSVCAIQTTDGGTNWQWNDNASTSIEGHWGNGYIGTSPYKNKKLETIYYGGDLYFILDGILVKTIKNFAPQSEGAVPGLMCFNTKATFTNNEFVTDAGQVKAEVEKYLAKDAKIDGDLSDWNDADVNRHSKTVKDETNGNSMTVRAFKGSDGLYIAYEVDHIVNLTPSKWDAGWWNNTNVEFYVNGNEEKNHYALTTFGNGGYMDSVMITTRKQDRTYSTVAEIFIPFASLERDGLQEGNIIDVGFAFKSANGTAEDKLNGTDWWSIDGNPGTVRFPVSEKGIGREFTLSYTAGAESDVTGEAPAPKKVFEGDGVSLAENPFTRSEYVFVCWSDGTSVYAAGEEFVMPGKDVMLTAIWRREGAEDTKYGVTYAAGASDVHGTVPTDSKTYATGDLITLAQNTLTREEYRFAGWNDGTKIYPAGSKIYMGEAAITLTAEWVKVYKLTYSADDDVEGNLPSDGKFAKGDKIQIKHAEITKKGYEFLGWSYNGKTYTSVEEFVMPEQDVTLMADWIKKIEITVDGDLRDWNEANVKTVGAQSLTDKRRAVWYGLLGNDGLHLAVDIYHDQFSSGQNNWWDNTNFEIHLGQGNQHRQEYVYVKNYDSATNTVSLGKSSSEMVVAYKLTQGVSGEPKYRSTFEIFLPASIVSGLKEKDGSLRVGLAVKSAGGSESITGGSLNYGTGDAWYAPYGVLPNVYDEFAYVTGEGIYRKNEYLNRDMQCGAESAAEDNGEITLDGNLADWQSVADKTLSVVGTDLYAGKSVTFYGRMTKKGLYLAVEAYHGSFVYGQNNWWDNTNFELRIGEVLGSDDNKWAKQFYVYATGTATFAVSETYMQLASKTEQLSSGKYHTVFEVFISAEDLVKNDYMVQNGMIHVGIAWKTNGDNINNNEQLDGSDTAAWWRPKGTHINTKPACVTGDGIYTAQEYEESMN